MSALQDIALDMSAESAGHPPAAPEVPATTLGRWQHWIAQLSLGGKKVTRLVLDLAGRFFRRTCGGQMSSTV